MIAELFPEKLYRFHYDCACGQHKAVHETRVWLKFYFVACPYEPGCWNRLEDPVRIGGDV